ncbi:hypothetical protein [Bifidobacterium scaligerum]|uniref:hypothetical protein n=1 Tax=Bifidobacterium scaligerum TaxID=2052656 RepID=UPI001056A80B|nr:hypothetical protein [Bifidobacterium scaligerum]
MGGRSFVMPQSIFSTSLVGQYWRNNWEDIKDIKDIKKYKTSVALRQVDVGLPPKAKTFWVLGGSWL